VSIRSLLCAEEDELIEIAEIRASAAAVDDVGPFVQVGRAAATKTFLCGLENLIFLCA
jgi:hypothetical protein